jgi:benzoylsuccinyl-CoA thiolase BbsB subunit
VSAVAVERADTVLVIGVEKLTAQGGGTIPLEATDLEVGQGVVMPGVYAMRARRYLHETGASPVHLAKVAVKAHRNAALNPYAAYRNEVTVDEVLGSRMIADPLTLYMCCPTADGAAAAVLTTSGRARQRGRTPVRVAASVLQSGHYKTGFRDMGVSDLTARTAALAYEQAGVGPHDVGVAEVHDAFAIAELMYYEALGFCGRGEGKDLIDGGETEIAGRRPVNPSGGLLCRGHPLGATGVAQVCEAVWQLTGRAGARQVAETNVALTHCTGGGISGLDHGACSITILTR